MPLLIALVCTNKRTWGATARRDRGPVAARADETAPRHPAARSAKALYFSRGLSLSLPADPIDISARPDRIMYQKSITPGMAINVVSR